MAETEEKLIMGFSGQELRHLQEYFKRTPLRPLDLKYGIEPPELEA